MRAKTILQIVIVLAGVFLGAYFSKLSFNLHDTFGHSELRVHPSMDHGVIDISYDSIIPQIEKLEMVKDPMSGWNLYIRTNNFKFTPENVNKQHKQGEGHAHLYINGNKIARLYDNWFHVPELQNEENQIKITLNANSHETMIFNNKPITKIIILKNIDANNQ